MPAAANASGPAPAKPLLRKGRRSTTASTIGGVQLPPIGLTTPRQAGTRGGSKKTEAEPPLPPLTSVHSSWICSSVLHRPAFSNAEQASPADESHRSSPIGSLSPRSRHRSPPPQRNAPDEDSSPCKESQPSVGTGSPQHQNSLVKASFLFEPPERPWDDSQCTEDMVPDHMSRTFQNASTVEEVLESHSTKPASGTPRFRAADPAIGMTQPTLRQAAQTIRPKLVANQGTLSQSSTVASLGDLRVEDVWYECLREMRRGEHQARQERAIYRATGNTSQPSNRTSNSAWQAADRAIPFTPARGTSRAQQLPVLARPVAGVILSPPHLRGSR